MGQVGAAGDNAAMESFFALLQNNVLDRRRWTTRHELRIAIITEVVHGLCGAGVGGLLPCLSGKRTPVGRVGALDQCH